MKIMMKMKAKLKQKKKQKVIPKSELSEKRIGMLVKIKRKKNERDFLSTYFK